MVQPSGGPDHRRRAAAVAPLRRRDPAVGQEHPGRAPVRRGRDGVAEERMRGDTLQPRLVPATARVPVLLESRQDPRGEVAGDPVHFLVVVADTWGHG